jgi:hypothetical protein
MHLEPYAGLERLLLKLSVRGRTEEIPSEISVLRSHLAAQV